MMPEPRTYLKMGLPYAYPATTVGSDRNPPKLSPTPFFLKINT